LTVIDLAEIEASTANSELDRIRARNELDRAKSELKKLVYLDAKQEIDVDKQIAEKFECVEPVLDEETLTTAAFVEREEIRTGQFELMKATEAYKADRYYYLPNVSMNFEYDLQGEYFFPFERSWTAGLKCEMNFGGTGLSSSGNTGHEATSGARSDSVSSSLSPFADISIQRTVIQAEAQFNSAKIGIEKLKRDIALEVAANTRRVMEDWEMLKILRTREDVLRKRFEIYQIKLKIGEAKRSDTLKAEVEHAKAKVETVKGVLEYITASLDLETSVGRPAGSLGTMIRKDKQ
jgi:outer membrane protein TolC